MPFPINVFPLYFLFLPHSPIPPILFFIYHGPLSLLSFSSFSHGPLFFPSFSWFSHVPVSLPYFSSFLWKSPIECIKSTQSSKCTMIVIEIVYLMSHSRFESWVCVISERQSVVANGESNGMLSRTNVNNLEETTNQLLMLLGWPQKLNLSGRVRNWLQNSTDSLCAPAIISPNCKLHSDILSSCL